MIKTSLKNFGKNLLYVFVPMGIVYLFLLIAVFSLIGALLGDASTTLDEIGSVIGSATQQSSTSVQEFLSYAFAQIDWRGNPLLAIKQILDTDWIQNTVKGFFATLNQSTEDFEEQITTILTTFKEKLFADIAVAAILCLLGILAANYATRFVLRSRVAKRNLKQFVVAHTLVPIVQSLLLIASLVLLATVQLYSLLVFVAFVALMGVVSICTSYLIYRDGSLKLKEVLTARNVLQHAAVSGIVTLIDIAVAIVLYFVNPLLDLLIMLPLIIYSANICDVNTDIFVIDLVQKRRSSQPSEAQ